MHFHSDHDKDIVANMDPNWWNGDYQRKLISIYILFEWQQYCNTISCPIFVLVHLGMHEQKSHV